MVAWGASTVYLLFWIVIVKSLPVVTGLMEVYGFSTLFGSPLLPAHMLLLECQWLWCHLYPVKLKLRINRQLWRYIIIKSKCLITEEQQETSAQSESQEESRQVTLTHTEHSIVVCPFSLLIDSFDVYRSRPSRPRTSTDPQNNQPLWWKVRIRGDQDLQGPSAPTTKSAHSSFQARRLWPVGEGL